MQGRRDSACGAPIVRAKSNGEWNVHHLQKSASNALVVKGTGGLKQWTWE